MESAAAATVSSQLQTRKVKSYSRRRGCKTVRHDAACQKPVVGGELKIFPWHKSEGMNRNLAWRVDDGTGSLSDAEPCAYLIRSTRLKKITSAREPVSNLDGELLTEEGAKVCVGDLERIIPFEQRVEERRIGGMGPTGRSRLEARIETQGTEDVEPGMNRDVPQTPTSM